MTMRIYLFSKCESDILLLLADCGEFVDSMILEIDEVKEVK